jgi:hypothetical protein
MSSIALKSLGKVVLAGLLFTGCGGEPIPVDLTKATEPCAEGAQLMTEGMMMVMRDGRLTVVPKDEREVRAFWPGWPYGSGELETEGGEYDQCQGCH